MTRSRLIRIIVPLLVALIVTAVVAKLTAGKASPTGEIVIAAHTVKAGSVLTPEDLQLRSVPARAALAGSLGSVGAAVGAVTRTELTTGAPVLSDELESSQAAGLDYQIPAGMRAFTVPVNGVSGVAGQLAAGDRVDVLATFTAQSSASNGGVAVTPHATVVVQDIGVLALGTGTGSVAPAATSSGTSSPYTLVTLAVTPQQAAVISLSEQQGTVAFLLRPHSGAGSGSASVSAGELPR